MQIICRILQLSDISIMAVERDKSRREGILLRMSTRDSVPLKRMPQKDLINIRNYDVRHLIPKVCSAVLKNSAEILIESTVK